MRPVVAVIGSRDYPNLHKVVLYLDALKKLVPEFKIVTGDARGVDDIARDWARRNSYECHKVKPLELSYFNYSIRLIFRDIEIVSKCHWASIFWDGKSSGTRFCIDLCKQRDIPYILHNSGLLRQI